MKETVVLTTAYSDNKYVVKKRCACSSYLSRAIFTQTLTVNRRLQVVSCYVSYKHLLPLLVHRYTYKNDITYYIFSVSLLDLLHVIFFSILYQVSHKTLFKILSSRFFYSSYTRRRICYETRK